MVKTGYFVLNKARIEGFKTRVISDKVFKITRDLKGNPLKAEKSLVMLDRDKIIDKSLDVIKEEVKDKDGNVTGTTEATYPELRLQGKILDTLKDGRVVVHALIPRWASKKTRMFLDADVEDIDPLSYPNIETLGIKDKFIGYNRQDVFDRFPELEGYNATTAGEQIVKIPKLMKHIWSGEI